MDTVDNNAIALADTQLDLRQAVQQLQQAAHTLTEFADALATEVTPQNITRGSRRSLKANTAMTAQSVQHDIHRLNDLLISTVQHIADLEVTE
jgi:hypothetical protein